MDALSDVLRFVHLTGGVFLDAEFSAPWCVKSQIGPEDCKPFLSQAVAIVSYHYVVDGKLMVQVAGGDPVALSAGDIVMFPRNDVHYLGNTIERDPVNAHELIQTPDDGGLMKIVHGGGGEQTRIVCGFLGTDAHVGPLLSSLPAMLSLSVAGTPGGDWIMQSFSFASHEISRFEPGASTVLSRMSELLFVEAVRRYLSSLPEEQKGWLAGLRDPIVGRALALLHARLSENWTTEALSQAVGLSRSAFADRFTALIGQPPMHYLASWRMQVAAQKLRERRAAVAQIAYDVGYESEAAFTRAFKRHFGEPPATWRSKAVHVDEVLPPEPQPEASLN